MKEFSFTDCIEIKELLGKRADDEKALMDLVEEAPLDAIYYHTHSYFLRHYYITGPYPNDFANWAGIQVRDRVLGEKLSSVTPTRSRCLEDVRDQVVEIIDGHLSEIKIIPSVTYGQPFYLMKSRIIEVPTNIEVGTLKEFREALAIVDASAIYNHIFEARMRVRKGKSDFALWLEEVKGLSDLADQIENVDAHMYSLEGLRVRLLELCDAELARGKK